MILNYLFSIKFHGVMVKIPDFLFGALSLSLDETYFLWIHNQVRKLHIAGVCDAGLTG